MDIINEMEISFKALSVNEGFARACVAAFCVQSNPTLDEITDIKTAVSEAVTNCVVHAYPGGEGNVTIKVQLLENGVSISIMDNGVGILDFKKAREPFFTSRPNEERSGMGFAVMETFMNKVELLKNGRQGLCVKMEKTFKKTGFKVVGDNV
ncbi:MAG: anti-sigma F factor [Clostridia bacterium]